MNIDLFIDGILVALFLWVARAALSSRELFQSIVLFIAFGMLLSIAWVRLAAPDVALAEAAIGAGLTGALLLVTWDALPHTSREPRANPDEEPEDAG